jgi:hypothetical protein
VYTDITVTKPNKLGQEYERNGTNMVLEKIAKVSTDTDIQMYYQKRNKI